MKNKANKYRLRWRETYEGSHGREYTNCEREDFETKDQMIKKVKEILKHDSLIRNSMEWVKLAQEQIIEWREDKMAYCRIWVDVEEDIEYNKI